MIFKLSSFRKAFLYFVQGPKFYGGGAPSGSSTVTTQATIPDELKPYIGSYMGAAEKQLYQQNDKGEVTGFQPYKAYGATFDAQGNQTGYDPTKAIANFSPLQQQSQTEAANLHTSGFGTAKGMSQDAGQGLMGSADTALGYGAQGQSIGAQGAADATRQASTQRTQLNTFGNAAADIGNTAAYNSANQANSQIGQAGQYGSDASNIGNQITAASSNQAGSQIGQAGQYGAQGANMGITAAGQAGQGYNAQANFANQATDPNAMGAYMSPYMQNVVNQQITAANRAYDITGSQEMANASRANAFGGSREALMAAENQRARNTDIEGIQATGLQNAYTAAQGQQQFGANLGIQGLNAGTNAMQAGIQGAQTGLQGVSAQTAASNMGIQGAQTGIQGQQAALQGVQDQTAASNMALQGAQTGIQGEQAGIQSVAAKTAASNMQLAGNQQALAGNAQGLQGVNAAQAGYTGANSAAGTLGNLAAQQATTKEGIIDTQNTLGAQQTAKDQAAKDQALLDYQNAQNKPLQDIGTMSSLVHGISTGNTAATTYGAQPSALSQIGGLAATGIGAYSALKANGGVITDRGYANGGIVGYKSGNAVQESMRSKLEDLDPTHLATIIKDNESPEMTKLAKEVLATSYARGGIVGYKELGYVEDQIPTGIDEDKKRADESAAKVAASKKASIATPAQTPTGIASIADPNAASITPVAQTPVAQTPIDPRAGLQASRDVAEKEANISVADRVQQQKDLEEKYVGKDTETEAYRKSIMDERANAPDEARRQMGMRLMEFGASWASTPGAPLVAGMKAITATLPGLMSDTKENKKMTKDLDKSEYLLNHATRLEELGRLKEATATKDKASELFRKHEEALVTYGLAQQKIASEEKVAREKNASNEMQQSMQSGSHILGAQISANARSDGDTYTTNQRINNLQEANKENKKDLENLKVGSADYLAAQEKIAQINEDINALNRKPKTETELKQERFATRYNARASAAQGAQ